VVGRNDLDNVTATTPFTHIFAVADLADTNTAYDPHRTAELLLRIGAQIGAGSDTHA
jgi:hypothetical protein